MIIAFIIPFFIWIKASSASPLGTYIIVCVYCAEQTDVGIEGVEVKVSGDFGFDTKFTGPDGCTDRFGSGYPVGTYTVSFMWNGVEQSKEVTVTCEKAEWLVEFYVPNPTIIKHFIYKTIGGVVTENFAVELWEDTDGDENVDVLVATAWTGETGTVTFGGDIVEVCKIYYLKYTWNEVEHTVGPIHFTAVGCKTSIVWEDTNELEPKSGGGYKKLYLVEELG